MLNEGKKKKILKRQAYLSMIINIIEGICIIWGCYKIVDFSMIRVHNPKLNIKQSNIMLAN